MGALSRVGLCAGINAIITLDFPLATLLVNVVGSFLMGLLMSLLHTARRHHDKPFTHCHCLLGVGLLGAFTTFSTFSHDTIVLAMHEHFLLAALNAAANVGLCLLAVWWGYTLPSFFSKERWTTENKKRHDTL